MPSSSLPEETLTSPPVRVSKRPKKSGCRTVFLTKILRSIRKHDDDPARRGDHRHTFHHLMANLVDSNNKEIPYRQSVAEELREWLLNAQRVWNKDMTTDLEIMLDSLERQAKQYTQAKEEERIRIREQQDVDDAEFVHLSTSDTELQSEWEKV